LAVVIMISGTLAGAALQFKKRLGGISCDLSPHEPW
jgi:hypothetical protein